MTLLTFELILCCASGRVQSRYLIVASLPSTLQMPSPHSPSQLWRLKVSLNTAKCPLVGEITSDYGLLFRPLVQYYENAWQLKKEMKEMSL